MSSLPLAFEPKPVPAGTAATSYLGRTDRFWLELQSSGAVLHFDPAHELRLLLQGANVQPRMTAERRLPGVTNYLLGHDASEWRTGVPQFARVRYEEVYPGIDTVYYGTQKQLEYDFIVKPGARPEKIRLQFDQADQVQITKDGDLAIRVGGRQIRQPKPVLYQDIAGRRVPVDGAYEWRARAIGFRIGRYDRTQPLVIDPALAYATYFGGVGNTWANGIAVDASGNLYLAGTTTATSLPGAAASSSSGVFVTKLNTAGTATLYTTYLSGVSSATALAIDSSGNAYVTGYTTSSNFPASLNAWRTTTAVGDSYVVKLNANGSQLLYATLLTGHNASNATTGIAVNAQGVAYVTGYTTDQQFPVTAGAFQSTYTSGASAQGFVSAVTADGSSLVASTYLGGNNRTVSNGIALDSSSQPVVTGYLGALGGPIATPDTFPTTAGAYQTVAKGGLEGFVTKLNAACSALVFSTYLGGSGTDAPRAIALDTTGNVYVTGYTKSLDYPVTSGAATPNGVGFYSRLDAAGAHLQYSTYLATESGPGIFLCPASEFSLCESGQAIAVDSNHTAYIVGLALGHFRVPATPGSLFSTPPSRSDAAFLLAYNPAGLQYGTYLGGPGVNSFSNGYAVTASGVAVDPANNVYFAFTTSDRNMPSTPGALLSQNLAPNNTAFAGKIDTSPTVCNGTISASPASFPMAGGSGTLTVSFPAGCPYAILSDNGLTFNAPISGTGTRQIPFVVAPNPLGQPARSLNFSTSSGQSYYSGPVSTSVTQAGSGCTFTLTPASVTLQSGVSLTVVSVSTGPNCSWDALANAPWLSTSVSFGRRGSTGSGSFLLTASANPSGQVRTGTVTVSGGDQLSSAPSVTLPVTQTAEACGYTVGATRIYFPAAGGAFDIPVTATGAGCPWTASLTAAVPLLSITSGSSGTGAGTIHIVAPALAAGQSYTIGTLSVAGYAIPIYEGIGDPSDLQLTSAIPRYQVFSAFTVPVGSTARQSHTLTLSNYLAGAYSFSSRVSGTPQFLSATADRGNTPANITLSVDPTGLAAGTYTNTITFSITNTATISYRVSLTVQAGAGNGAKASIYRAQSGLVIADVNADATCCTGDLLGYIGQAGDIPLLGDWTGDGVRKFGLYRPSTGLFLLDTNNNATFDQGVDKALTFVPETGDLPVLGDWTGSGVDRVGVFRGSNGTWYLDVNGDGSFTGRAYLGQTGDVPLVGHWPGLGAGTRASVGIYRPSAGFFLVDANGDGEYTSADPPLFYLGRTGDIPLVGDWDGSGTTKVGVYRQSTGLFVLDQNGSFTWDGPSIDRALFFGPLVLNTSTGITGPIPAQPGDIPVTGNWAPSYGPYFPTLNQTQGRTRTGLYRPSTGTFYFDTEGDGTYQGWAYLGQAGDVPLGTPVIVNGTIQAVTGK